jgi:zinc transporter ZupT
MSSIHGEVRERTVTKVLLSISSLLGIIFAAVVVIPVMVDNILVSLIAGVLLYIIVREFIPEKEKGQPAFFVIGVVLFLAVSLITTTGHR